MDILLTLLFVSLFCSLLIIIILLSILIASSNLLFCSVCIWLLPILLLLLTSFSFISFLISFYVLFFSSVIISFLFSLGKEVRSFFKNDELVPQRKPKEEAKEDNNKKPIETSFKFYSRKLKLEGLFRKINFLKKYFYYKKFNNKK